MVMLLRCAGGPGQRTNEVIVLVPDRVNRGRAGRPKTLKSAGGISAGGQICRR
jgi:hypothetical protein